MIYGIVFLFCILSTSPTWARSRPTEVFLGVRYQQIRDNFSPGIQGELIEQTNKTHHFGFAVGISVKNIPAPSEVPASSNSTEAGQYWSQAELRYHGMFFSQGWTKILALAALGYGRTGYENSRGVPDIETRYYYFAPGVGFQYGLSRETFLRLEVTHALVGGVGLKGLTDSALSKPAAVLGLGIRGW